MPKVKWQEAPQEHDYPAAAQYLSLLVGDPALRAELAGQLHDAPVAHYKAKDLLRASQLPLLPESNLHVAADLRKIRKRQRAVGGVARARRSHPWLPVADRRRLSPRLRELLRRREHRHPVPAHRPADRGRPAGQDRVARDQARGRRRVGRCLAAASGRERRRAAAKKPTAEKAAAKKVPAKKAAKSTRRRPTSQRSAQT